MCPAKVKTKRVAPSPLSFFKGGLAGFLDRHFDLGPVTPLAPGNEHDDGEISLASLIPYTVPYDDQTIITKDDALISVMKLGGIYSDSLSAGRLKGFAQMRNTLWRAIADPTITVYAHLIRRKTTEYPEGEGEVFLSRAFNRAWRQNFEDDPFYVNDIYLTLVCSRVQQRSGLVGDLITSINKKLNRVTNAKEDDPFLEQSRKMQDCISRIVLILSDYGPRILRIQRWPKFDQQRVKAAQAFSEFLRFGLPRAPFVERFGLQPDYNADDVLDYLGPETSEIESFLAYLVNLQETRVAVTSDPIDRRILHSSVNAKLLGKFLEIESIGSRRIASVVSMGAWPEKPNARMLDDLLTTPAEFVMTQSFRFVGRLEADIELQRQIRQLAANDEEANEENIEASKAMRANLLAGRAVDGLHHFTILVHVEAPAEIENPEDKKNAIEALNDAVSKVTKGFLRMSVKPIREYLGTMTFFLSQLPGQHPKFIGRRGTITSENFAGFFSMHNTARGRIDGNLWGPAIMPFRTVTGSAYQYNFHREMDGMVPGHLGVAGKTGSGKTAIVTALLTMADKARPKVFYFDNREGAYVYMMAMGGKHYRLSPIRRTGWNPFQLPDTEENRLLLTDLMRMMREYHGERASEADFERFNKAINENYDLPNPKDRRLRNIAWCFGSIDKSTLASSMKAWYGDGALAGIFDNEEDNIDFGQCRHYCFEQRELIVDGVARKELPIMLHYLMHRITLSMNGDPFIIVLDEGQNLVKHQIWQQKIDSLIMQIRRKNGLLVFITPDARYLYDPVESIRKQSASLLLLPDKEAERGDYVNHLELTDDAFRFVQQDAMPRDFLVKRGDDNIRLNFDLDVPNLKQFIPILSGNEKSARLMHAIIEEFGTTDPDVWVPVLMDRAMAQNTHNLRLVA